MIRFRIVFSAITVLAIMCSCSNNVMIDDLCYKKQIFSIDCNEPFTGLARSKFDDGEISEAVHFRKGIPDGEWKSFGYDREVIYHGLFVPVNIKPTPGVVRIVLRKTFLDQDGISNANDLLVIKDENVVMSTSEYENICDKYRQINNTEIDTVIVSGREF